MVKILMFELLNINLSHHTIIIFTANTSSVPDCVGPPQTCSVNFSSISSGFFEDSSLHIRNWLSLKALTSKYVYKVAL